MLPFFCLLVLLNAVSTICWPEGDDASCFPLDKGKSEQRHGHDVTSFANPLPNGCNEHNNGKADFTNAHDPDDKKPHHVMDNQENRVTGSVK